MMSDLVLDKDCKKGMKGKKVGLIQSQNPFLLRSYKER